MVSGRKIFGVVFLCGKPGRRVAILLLRDVRGIKTACERNSRKCRYAIENEHVMIMCSQCTQKLIWDD
jgi:hypothetical protein